LYILNFVAKTTLLHHWKRLRPSKFCDKQSGRFEVFVRPGRAYKLSGNNGPGTKFQTRAQVCHTALNVLKCSRKGFCFYTVSQKTWCRSFAIVKRFSTFFQCWKHK